MSMSTKFLMLVLLLSYLPYLNSAYAGETDLKEFGGVVTYNFIPAKVMKVNEIIADPRPGTSYIGEKSILVEVDKNPDVMANWTIVGIKYYKYKSPKTITYKFMSEQHTLKVNYHAVNVEIDGDLSRYINDH